MEATLSERLFAASSANRAEEIEDLCLNSSVNVDSTETETGSTPLHVAAAAGNAEAIRILVHLGANVARRNRCGLTPLHISCTYGYEKAASVLIQMGADPMSPQSSTPVGQTTDHPLCFASRAGSIPTVKALVQLGARVDAPGKDGFLPLHWAAQHGHALLVSKLIAEHAAAVNSRSEKGFTALHLAGFQGHSDTIVRLLAFGADPAQTDKEGCSALHKAAQNRTKGARGITLILKAITSSGSFVTQKSSYGWSPFSHAAYHNNESCLKALLEGATGDKVSCDEFDSDLKLALNLAARNSSFEC